MRIGNGLEIGKRLRFSLRGRMMPAPKVADSHTELTQPSSDRRQFLYVLLFALVIHGLVLVLLPFELAKARTVEPSREQVIQIDLTELPLEVEDPKPPPPLKEQAPAPPDEPLLQPEPKPEQKPETVVEPEPEQEPIIVPEPEPIPEPEPVPPEPAPQPEVPKVITTPKPDPKPKAQPVPITKPKPRPTATPKPRPRPKPVTKPKLEPKSKPAPTPVRPKVKPTPTPQPEPDKKRIRWPFKKKTESKATNRSNSSTKPAQKKTIRGRKAGATKGSTGPEAKRSPNPPYPLAARKARLEGTTLLRVQILANGKVGSVSVARSSGHSVLDEAAVKTVRSRWRFKPATKNGTPVSCYRDLPVIFQLR